MSGGCPMACAPPLSRGDTACPERSRRTPFPATILEFVITRSPWRPRDLLLTLTGYRLLATDFKSPTNLCNAA